MVSVMLKERADMSIPDELKCFLEDVLCQLKPSRSLEFGTGAGIATEIIAKHTNCLVTIDQHEEWSRHAWKKLGHKYHNIGFKVRFDGTAPGKDFDFLFIDGPKGGNARKKAFEMYIPLLAKDCVIIADDTNRRKDRAFFLDLASYGFNCILFKQGRGIGFAVKGNKQVDLTNVRFCK